MFFSLDRTVTKNQKPNTKYQKCFVVCFNSKKEENNLSSSLLKLKRQKTTTLAEILFLVIGQSNEKNKTYQFFVTTWTIPPFWMSIPPLWTSFRTTGILWKWCQTIFRAGPIGLISAHWAPLNWGWSTVRIIPKITFPPLVIYSNPNCRIWKTRYFSNWNNKMKCEIKSKYS